ncbi:MAG: tetratricopeptide repeat protein [Pseudomonadota bacterium]|nr:tetratricopeptide repeat protein [Pseudomonadota bacterium]
MIETEYGEWLARGQAHQQASRLIDAMLCYRQALKSNRNAVQVQFQLGEVLRDLGRRDEALAAFRMALTWQPKHLASLIAAGDLLRAAEPREAAAHYKRAASLDPRDDAAREGLALSSLAFGETGALDQLSHLLRAGTLSPGAWDELARLLAAVDPSPDRTKLLRSIAARADFPPSALLLAIVIENASGAPEDPDLVVKLFHEAERREATIDDPEALRRLAMAAGASGRVDVSSTWAKRYAQRCIAMHAPPVPLLWPRRTAGGALRVAYLVPRDSPSIAGLTIDIDAFLRHVVAKHARERFAPSILFVGDSARQGVDTPHFQGIPLATLGIAPGLATARLVAETDYDALIDLGGMAEATGTFLAARPARTVWTYSALRGAHVEPLITHLLPSMAIRDGNMSESSWSDQREAIEHALTAACANATTPAATAALTPAAMASLWHQSVAAHQRRDLDAALEGYRAVLAEQPGHAPALYLQGLLLRDRGNDSVARSSLAAAIAAAPLSVDARIALANLERERGDVDSALALCRAGLALAPDERSRLALRRAVGLAELARHDATAARAAFEEVLKGAPTDADAHYNHGVALQMMHLGEDALRAYQRALALDAGLIAADFNIGVILQEQGRTDAAITAFEQVIARDPRHVPAHKALGDTLLGARRVDDWLRVFARFEASCPQALSLAVQALEVYQYRGDFAGLDRYLDRLRQDEFKPENETDLADCLEQLLFLLLYFDIEPDAQLGLYRTYDAVAQRVYGKPLPAPERRREGRTRIGYLSGDLRNQVMGKMMWSAIQHHDRDRYEIHFYSLTSDDDEWTERYRRFGDHFEALGDLPEREAARRIAASDLDLLVDLSTHTKGAKPGILALKPARVQITHVASAGVVGLSAIDFKLTDAFADTPENQSFQIETLLPMAGCVYPYRHIEPAAEHPFHRSRLSIRGDAIVIGAFVTPLKLSRRCLSLWREVMERAPGALLAISPLSADARGIYGRLFSAANIPLTRVIVLPQGRNDEENQARYRVIDFTLDPLPYGGVNGTLEALDMGVPVVTLCGKKHGERTSYSILENLGVRETVAGSGSEYVDIAVRLATDAQFMSTVRAAIRSGLAHSALTDMPRHTRSLESAYDAALARAQRVASGGMAP